MPSRLSTDPISRNWSQRLFPAVAFSQISGRSFQRLTAADLDGRGAQPSQVVHVLAHSCQCRWRGVRVVHVTADALAVVDRDDLREDGMTRGLEAARHHSGFSPLAVEGSEHRCGRSILGS